MEKLAAIVPVRSISLLSRPRVSVCNKKSSGIATLPSGRPAIVSTTFSNIERITDYKSAMTAEQFATDAKTLDATQYCLLRISEAAVKLGDLAEREAPDQP